MPTPPPAVTDAEWRIMDTLWSRGPATAADVVAALAGSTDWSPRTVKTLLGRLLRKKALGHRTDGNRYTYFAKVSREACLRRESRSFTDRLFAGDGLQAVLHLARTADLSPRDLQLLRKLLKENRP